MRNAARRIRRRGTGRGRRRAAVLPGGFTLIAAVVCALATAGMVVAVFSPIRTIPASADWERSEA
ncbi:MAG: hypothetical protein ACLTR9_08475 [Bifidobacterium bifidum]